jgi:glycosyltransferase involved in cell wall biosynthesis
MQALIQQLGLDDSLTILGQKERQEVAAILARSDIFVHLVRYEEALGGVILEAMASRVPVVAFNRGGIAECFTNATAGFLAPAGDVAAAAQHVLQLVDDPALRRSMGAAAAREVAARFAAGPFFSAMAAVYGLPEAGTHAAA